MENAFITFYKVFAHLKDIAHALKVCHSFIKCHKQCMLLYLETLHKHSVPQQSCFCVWSVKNTLGVRCQSYM